MLTLERLVRDLWHLPILARIGLAIVVLGVHLDVTAHLLVADGHAHVHTADQVTAHLIVLVGMVLVLAGVVIDGVRRTRPGRPPGNTSKGAT